MSEKLIDLHTHTKYSDGDLSPYDLIKLAIGKNIGTIAITDHDTVSGIRSLDKNSKDIVDSGIHIINGIEFSAKVDHGKMHILGYGIDINNKHLLEKIKEIKYNNIEFFMILIGILERYYGIRFASSDIDEVIDNSNNLGRVDIAKLCIRYKYVSSVKEAFSKYLNEAYEKVRDKNKNMTYEECINLILESGGIPVLAHPKSLNLDGADFLYLLINMIKEGLLGMEVYHSSHSYYEMEYYLNIANKYNLLISGGTDFHGKSIKPDIELGTGCKNNIKIKSLSILNHLK